MDVGNKTNIFVDNDGNRIVTTMTAVSAEVHENVTLGVSAGFDVMTCASVDVVSAATPKGYFEEVRQEYDGNAAFQFGLWNLSVAGIFSSENDYSSLSGSIGLTGELAKRNTTLALGYSFTESDVGRAGDPLFNRDLDGHTATTTLTQMFHPRLVGQASYFLSVLDGYQSSPYRLVRVGQFVSAPERVPELRVRQSATLRLKWAISPRVFLSGDYRFYLDSWSVSSHTVEISLAHQPTPWFMWRIRNRAYWQEGASFYASAYDEPMLYMTADRELGALVGDLVGLKFMFTPALSRPYGLSFDVKADVTYSRFRDFPLLPERLMAVVEVGLRLTF
jgi:hypothetical protein